MVLSSFGLDIAEAELRVRCDCTVFGTDALKSVDTARPPWIQRNSEAYFFSSRN